MLRTRPSMGDAAVGLSAMPAVGATFIDILLVDRSSVAARVAGDDSCSFGGAGPN
jgi:hypothetical protein